MTPDQIAIVTDLFKTMAAGACKAAGSSMTRRDDETLLSLNVRVDEWGKTTITFRSTTDRYLTSTPMAKGKSKVTTKRKRSDNW